MLDAGTVEKKCNSHDDSDPEEPRLMIKSANEWRKTCRGDGKQSADHNINPEQRRTLLVGHRGTLDGSCREAEVPKQTEYSREGGYHPQ